MMSILLVNPYATLKIIILYNILIIHGPVIEKLSAIGSKTPMALSEDYSFVDSISKM